LLAEGRVNKEIAAALNLGVETVRSHRKSLMNKLEIHNVADLTRFAASAGVIAIAEPEVASANRTRPAY
jgi:two-component system, NarL family, response regulator NreC